ncbi:hypothetical protein, partial [Photorhabdus asymbiotica]
EGISIRAVVVALPVFIHIHRHAGDIIAGAQLRKADFTRRLHRRWLTGGFRRHLHIRHRRRAG